MIELFTWATSNGLKPLLALEEAGLPYRVTPVDIEADAQFAPAFLKVSPNAKIPAILDHAPADGGPPLAIFESGAVLLHVADRSGRLMPDDPRLRLEAMQWIFWQVGGFGPILGQLHHFNRKAPEGQDYARARFTAETRRLYGVLDARLADRDFIAGDYSVADAMCWPWARRHPWQKVDLSEFPSVAAWYDRIGKRPATVRAVATLEALRG